jgi:hypothetical protein
LHKEHKEEIESKAVEKGSNFLPGTAKYIGKAVIPIQGEPDEELGNKEIKEKTLLAN